MAIVPLDEYAVYRDCCPLPRQPKFECSLGDLIEIDEPVVEETETTVRPRYVPKRSLSEFKSVPDHLRRLQRPDILPTIASIASLCGSTDLLQQLNRGSQDHIARRPSGPLIITSDSGLSISPHGGLGKRIMGGVEDADLEVEVEDEDEDEGADEYQSSGRGSIGSRSFSRSRSVASLKRWVQRVAAPWTARRSLRRSKSQPNTGVGDTPRMSLPAQRSERAEAERSARAKDDIDLASIIKLPWDD